MKILLFGIEHSISQTLATQLLAKNHTIIAIVEPASHDTNRLVVQTSTNLSFILDDPTHNGSWLKAVHGQYDVILNATFPDSPSNRRFNTQQAAAYLQSITRNISILTKDQKTPVIQPLPITVFQPPGNNPNLTIGTDSQNGWGSAYLSTLKLARQACPHLYEIYFGQLLCDTEGTCYSADLPSFGHFVFPLDRGENSITYTHINDLIHTMIWCVENTLTEKQLFVMGTEKVEQHTALQLFSQKQNKSIINLPIPLPLAKLLFGSSTELWCNNYTPQPFTLSKYGQFLKFPTLKSALHLP